MNLHELDNFRLSDAVKFHNNLNPVLFDDDRLHPEVREQLLLIVDDFLEHLGIDDLKIKDITLVGSNAAYTYTPHSDIDVHILVNMDKLQNDDVYRELFTAKKNAFNDSHDIKVNGYDVELYIQDAANQIRSLGEYSIKRDRWIKYPSKNRTNFDERATKLKFAKLVQLIELALRSKNLVLVQNLLDTLKRYRTAGLSVHGEFGPENLVWKALRSHGVIEQLFDLRDRLHSKYLSLRESDLLDRSTLTPEQIITKHGMTENEFISQFMIGFRIELEHTNNPSIAKEIALDHLAEDPQYYTKLRKVGLEEASGYIPSNRERNYPQFKTALTVDVRPDSIQINATKLGLGKIKRAGIPPTLNANGKI